MMKLQELKCSHIFKISLVILEMYYKQLLDEVFVISGSASADNTNRDLDYSGYHQNRI